MRRAPLFLLALACSPAAEPVPYRAQGAQGVAIAVRGSRPDELRVYVENTGPDRAALAIEAIARRADGAELARRLRDIDPLYPEYGVPITLRFDLEEPPARFDVRVIDVERTADEGAWTELDVVWDEPVPHGAGVEVRARRCAVERRLLRCELGVRNFGAKSVDVSLRAGLLVRGREIASIDFAGPQRFFPGDAMVMLASGEAPPGARVAVHGIVRTPRKRQWSR